MTATATARSRNRIAPFLNTPKPVDPAVRETALADAVFAAVLALQAQLTHPDAAVVRAAAMAILDLEKTRLRHGRPVVGTAECTPHPPGAVFSEPHPEGAEYVPTDEPDDTPPHLWTVERVQRMLQARADAEGKGEVISRAFAEAVARNLRERAAGPPGTMAASPSEAGP